MNAYNYLQPYFSKSLRELSEGTLESILLREHLSISEFATCLLDNGKYLEAMAQRVKRENLQYFGPTVSLYTPLYIANYCENKCIYCGFHTDQNIKRTALTMVQIEAEAKQISKSGLKHILVLTGESRRHSSVEYIGEAVKILKKYFDAITIEIYPLTLEEYKFLINLGVDGLTLYQEVYDRKVYEAVHIKGPKSDFINRLDAVERGAKAGMRTLGIGALLGLSDLKKELFLTGLHAYYLQKKYPWIELSISLPRIKTFEGMTFKAKDVTDFDFVNGLLSLKLFLPNVAINISTRESEDFRNNLLNIAVNKMSAGVTTKVGGHTEEDAEAQFDISDTRSVSEIKTYLINNNLQPIMKDWMQL